MATIVFAAPHAATRPSRDGEPSWSLRRARPAVASTRPAALADYLGALRASRPRARLQLGVELLPTLVHECQHASITAVVGERLEVLASSDRTSRRADELQDELEEGPCLQAVRTGHSVLAEDLGAETRWPGWCSAAADALPVRSVLSVLLVTGQLPDATVNLYSDAVGGLATVDLALVHSLAGPLLDALLDGRTGVDQLGPAARGGRRLSRSALVV
jgi:hypothetical protein